MMHVIVKKFPELKNSKNLMNRHFSKVLFVIGNTHFPLQNVPGQVRSVGVSPTA